MKIALIITTINTPHVLRLYRAYGPEVRFFVALDTKTPKEIGEVLFDLNCDLVWGGQYKCSELIGWNCIQRRNIALLEAVKWGADVIVSVDDDNFPMIPLLENYFSSFTRHLASRPYWDAQFNGLKASSLDGWFDVGKLFTPPASHRGFPHTKTAQPRFGPIVSAKIGVCAGICLGDPDISAVTRIANGPIVHGVSELLRAGIVVDPKETRTVFNSQNTSFIRELAPAFFMTPGVGRMDDIYASLVMQRVMADRGYHVHFGKPFVWQQRNSHDLVGDLRQEIDGMTGVEQLADWLWQQDVPTGAISTKVRWLYERMPLIPETARCAAMAFLDDCEGVL